MTENVRNDRSIEEEPVVLRRHLSKQPSAEARYLILSVTDIGSFIDPLHLLDLLREGLARHALWCHLLYLQAL